MGVLARRSTDETRAANRLMRASGWGGGFTPAQPSPLKGEGFGSVFLIVLLQVGADAGVVEQLVHAAGGVEALVVA